MERNFSNNGDFLRFFAAFLVCVYHTIHSSGNGDYDIWIGQENLGSIGISFFFVLSGIFLSKSRMRHADASLSSFCLSYMVRRLLRIFPGLAVFTLLAIVVGAFVSEYSVREYFEHPLTFRFLLNIFAFDPVYSLPGVFLDVPFAGLVNLNVWTIPLELTCYFMLLLAFLFASRWIAFVLICLCACLYMYVIVYGYWLPFSEVTESTFLFSMKSFYLFRYVALFMMGVLLGHYHDRIPVNLAVYSMSILGVLLTAFLPVDLGKFVFILFFPFLVFVLLHADFGKNIKAFGKYGDISYGFYLYNVIILQLVQQVSEGQWPFFLYVAVTFTLSIITGYVSFHLVEKRFLTRYRSS